MQFTPRLEEEMSRVDWSKVTQAETTSFSLALGLYSDQASRTALWRASWQTALGSVISMCALSLVITLVMRLTVAMALEAVVVTQSLRALWLFRKAVKASREAFELEGDAIQEACDLSKIHPSTDGAQ